ncbi:uncharacterized protein K452DRAFT_329087 [Aplosporella prunicola CBS 121167]|uniref:Uncharacterized protein n=1 Tax=Aplosporella prunicola CBS 121167 TaxID=1176127 RepID=A0A6A6B3E5_9PEZI|nr:uncharacterized protein K452DRAFT_329087 [Aplosporella prunicola CBS 121167]KAF2137734.1 hypothetical protein K452DRAFT_329087 [Aplosporella prunicola CBS 121167]
MLAPPFSRDHSLLGGYIYPSSIFHRDRLIRPKKDFQSYLYAQLETQKVNAVHQHLWLAGLPRPARPLHRQQVLQRAITIAEDPNQHLVWHESCIYIKPLPPYLLDLEFWKKNLCPQQALYQSACGLLLSYTWLISYECDWKIARAYGLIPESMTWRAWVTFADDLLDHIEGHHSPLVDKRYFYGELRLSRLNAIYRLVPPVFSLKHMVYGFSSNSTWYKQFFTKNFGWLLAAFAYANLALSAMQVDVSLKYLEDNPVFHKASYGFVATVLLAIVLILGGIFFLWAFLFWRLHKLLIVAIGIV